MVIAVNANIHINIGLFCYAKISKSEIILINCTTLQPQDPFIPIEVKNLGACFLETIYNEFV